MARLPSTPLSRRNHNQLIERFIGRNSLYSRPVLADYGRCFSTKSDQAKRSVRTIFKDSDRSGVRLECDNSVLPFRGTYSDIDHDKMRKNDMVFG